MSMPTPEQIQTLMAPASAASSVVAYAASTVASAAGALVAQMPASAAAVATTGLSGADTTTLGVSHDAWATFWATLFAALIGAIATGFGAKFGAERGATLGYENQRQLMAEQLEREQQQREAERQRAADEQARLDLIAINRTMHCLELQILAVCDYFRLILQPHESDPGRAVHIEAYSRLEEGPEFYELERLPFLFTNVAGMELVTRLSTSQENYRVLLRNINERAQIIEKEIAPIFTIKGINRRSPMGPDDISKIVGKELFQRTQDLTSIIVTGTRSSYSEMVNAYGHFQAFCIGHLGHKNFHIFVPPNPFVKPEDPEATKFAGQL